MSILISVLIGFVLSNILILTNYWILKKIDYIEELKDISIKDFMLYKVFITKKIIIDLISILVVFTYINNGFILNIENVLYILFLLLLLNSAITDVMEGYILNIFTYSGIVIIFVLNFVIEARYEMKFDYIIAFLLILFMFGIIMLIYKDKFGLGDVKLYLMIALYYGFIGTMSVLFISTLLGLIFGAFMFLKYKESKPFVFGPFIVLAVLIIDNFNLIDVYINYFLV